MSQRIRIGRTSDIIPGTATTIKIGKKTVAVFNLDGQFFAIDNTCRHRGGPLNEGKLSGTVVTCPWHGWKYDITTGANLTKPEMTTDIFPVTIEDDIMHIDV